MKHKKKFIEKYLPEHLFKKQPMEVKTQTCYLLTTLPNPKGIRLVGTELYVEKHADMVVLTKEDFEKAIEEAKQEERVRFIEAYDRVKKLNGLNFD